MDTIYITKTLVFHLVHISISHNVLLPRNMSVKTGRTSSGLLVKMTKNTEIEDISKVAITFSQDDLLTFNMLEMQS